MTTKHLDACLLDCLLVGNDKMKIVDEASRQSSAQLLAIGDGGMEIANEASRYSSAQLLAIMKSA